MPLAAVKVDPTLPLAKLPADAALVLLQAAGQRTSSGWKAEKGEKKRRKSDAVAALAKTKASDGTAKPSAAKAKAKAKAEATPKKIAKAKAAACKLKAPRNDDETTRSQILFRSGRSGPGGTKSKKYRNGKEKDTFGPHLLQSAWPRGSMRGGGARCCGRAWPRSNHMRKETPRATLRL